MSLLYNSNMNFNYEPALENYMRQKGKHNIVVEIVSSDSSDFQVTELHVHFVDEKRTDFLTQKKSFRSLKTHMGIVLLPPYRLEYEDTVTFSLKSFLGIKYVTQRGIKL